MAETIYNNDKEEWIFVRVLGSGAFGIVELWNNVITMEKIAIKKCQMNVNNINTRQRERWDHEISIMNQLNHPNIVATRGIPNQIIQSSNELPVLCMEYCSKGDLRSVLDKCENLCGIQEYDALRVMYDVASAVEYLHSHKITHRDLKPSNIVMQQINNKIVYKLIDLGYAKELGDGSISASIVGTLNYLAPELFWKKTYSCSVDYWSLGILFYEIITGTRPFLPNMPLTKIWMNHIQGKKYEHISAREINGEVNFFQDIEEPNHLSHSLKEDLVKWFRIVFQWDPKKRGKSSDEFTYDRIMVFSMLKSILDKKIIHTFIVSHYKFESYHVNSHATIGELKQIIAERENVAPNQQILTDSTGNILDDQQTLTTNMENIIVFNSETLCIGNMPKPKISQYIQEMMARPRADCDYYTLRRYYGATIFFMNYEVKLYRFYILSLSIMIDLCDTKLKVLSANIKKLISDKNCLIIELESMVKLMQNCRIDKYKNEFEMLEDKITKFFDGITQMMEKFDVLHNSNEQLKTFSDINWMTEISSPHDEVLNLFNIWNKECDNRREKPLPIVKLIFQFLAIRNDRLSNTQLLEYRRNIMQFQKNLIQSEKVLTSFEVLLKFYSQNINRLNNEYVKECQAVQEMDRLNKDRKVDASPSEIEQNLCNYPVNITAGTNDPVIYESIVISNMIGSLISEMDVWKQKIAALSNFNN